ncbi:MAG: hypothetical protein CMK59_03920 [Proteobacteria bacterium]|nr:hypothetical protein [Pseudomonadota bacterium]
MYAHLFFSQILLTPQSLAVVLPPTEEELASYADLGVTGEVVNAECLSSSYNEDSGTTVNVYLADVSIQEVLTGEYSDAEVQVLYRRFEYDSEPESCADSGDDHMHGTHGNYYMAALEDGSFEILGQFIEGSVDTPPPECVDTDSEPSSETESEDTGLGDAKGGCSTTGLNELSLSALFSFLFICFRRRS